MVRERRRAAQEADDSGEPIIDAVDAATAPVAPPVSVETVELEDIVQEGLALARGMRASNVYMTVRMTPCERLPEPLDRHPNGIGGQTLYGVYLETDWRTKHEPFFESESAEYARLVFNAMTEEKEVSWRITRPQTEETTEAEPALRIRQTSDGAGSSQPDDSSERRTGGRRQVASLAKRHRSRRTSSRR